MTQNQAATLKKMMDVNGGGQTSVQFSGTVGQWLEKTVSVSLNAGTNTIEIDHYWGYMYFDYLDIDLPVLCAQGDLNLDCVVDMGDVLILAEGWLNPYSNIDLGDVSADWLE